MPDLRLRLRQPFGEGFAAVQGFQMPLQGSVLRGRGGALGVQYMGNAIMSILSRKVCSQRANSPLSAMANAGLSLIHI